MTGTVLLIAEVAVGGVAAKVLAACAAIMFTALWFLVPSFIDRTKS